MKKTKPTSVPSALDLPTAAGRRAAPCSALLELPTADEIRSDPDRILELYDACPKCGSTALEALTWKSIGRDDVTVGCWNCEWIILPPGYTPPDEPEGEDDE